MRKIVFILSLWLFPALVFAGSNSAESGARRNVTVDPTFEDWGNNARTRGISVSSTTMSPVVVSTYPSNANLGISEWRYREIVNVSTGSAIRLIFNDDPYELFSSSVPVILSSDTTGGGYGDKYIDRSQCKIEAIQSSNLGLGGNGLQITEYYHK